MRDILLEHDREPQPAVFCLKHLHMQLARHQGKSYTYTRHRRPSRGVAEAHAAGIGMRHISTVVMLIQQRSNADAVDTILTPN